MFKKKDQVRQVYARTDFGPPPPGYVPGFGRGAVGFITRSDIGEAINQGGPEAAAEENLNENQYDNWAGYGGSLFDTQNLDDDDKEADKIYDQIDDHMDERRKDRRTRKLEEDLKKMQKEKPTIAQQFSDLKRDLVTISHDEWSGIPDAVDYSIKKVKKEKYIPIPDSIIEGARKDQQLTNTISVSDGASTPLVNLNDIGSARGTILASQLDKQQDSVEGIKTVDKKGMLTELSSVHINTEAEIGDFEKVRKIMKSIINSNPKNSDGWIAAARIEELDGKVQNARNILNQGLKFCEDSDDLWLETARMEPPENSRAILAKAVQTMPKSVKIWIQATNIEPDVQIKKKILKRSLEHIPNNPRLWKDLIEYEQDEEEARELLYKAVECVPGNIEMWLALAKLETYENAKKVLNKARKALPTEHSLWIAASKLEEAEGKDKQHIEQLVIKGIQILKKNGYIVNREDWLQEAEFCERSGNPLVCNAVARAVCLEGLLDGNAVTNILEDMQNLKENRSLTTVRALYFYACENISANKDILNAALDLEIDYLKVGEENHLDNIINICVKMHPSDEQFWLKCTKNLWKQKEKAKSLIHKAMENMPENENILLLASKLEREMGNTQEARNILQKAHSATEQGLVTNFRTYKHLLKFELQYGNLDLAFDLAQKALKLFIREEKIIVICALIHLKVKGIESARKVFRQGLEYNKLSPLLWLEQIQMEMRINNFAGARPLLEKARLKIPKSPELLRLAVRLEVEANNKKGALFLLSKALKDLPQDGELWSLRIELEPKVSRKKIINEALGQCEKDPYIYISGAKLFWKEKKFEKVKRWLELAIKKDAQVADCWIYLYHYESTNGKKDKAEELSNKIENMQLKKGRLWNSVRKTDLGWNQTFQEILAITCNKIEKELSRIE